MVINGTWAMHSTTSVCNSYRANECINAVICVVLTERPRWIIPAAVHFLSKPMTTGWHSKLLSTICLIWVFCFHLSLGLHLKAAALPPFALLFGSEENDNNESWPSSTASHKHFTLVQGSLCAATYSCKLSNKQCVINDGSLFVTAHSVRFTFAVYCKF